MGIDRRQHERIEIAIEVRVCGHSKEGSTIEEITLSGNISMSGCAVLLACDLVPGSVLDLEFRFPKTGEQEPRVFTFRGEVVRSTRVNAAQFIAGMRFLDGLFPMDVLR
jgi:hypothetical protein